MKADDPELGLNVVVSRLLAAGLAASGLCVVVGLLLAASGRGVIGDSAVPLPALPAALAASEPTAWLSLGLVLLLVTPAARVATLAAGYAARRRWALAAVSVSVLGVLGLSLVLSVGH